MLLARVYAGPAPLGLLLLVQVIVAAGCTQTAAVRPVPEPPVEPAPARVERPEVLPAQLSADEEAEAHYLKGLLASYDGHYDLAMDEMLAAVARS